MRAAACSLKLFADRAPGELPDALIRVFHQWIQRDALDEILLDVVDYRHVHRGPGVVLLAHGARYSLDLEGGEPGLLLARRRPADAVAPEMLLADTFRRAAAAATLLEEEPLLDGAFRFSSGRARLRLEDRGDEPHGPVAASIGDALAALLDRLSPGAAVRRAVARGRVAWQLAGLADCAALARSPALRPGVAAPLPLATRG